jgi:hypothetical protein
MVMRVKRGSTAAHMQMVLMVVVCGTRAPHPSTAVIALLNNGEGMLIHTTPQGRVPTNLTQPKSALQPLGQASLRPVVHVRASTRGTHVCMLA